MKHFLFLITVFISCLSFSQQKATIDSLKAIIATTTNDSIKMYTFDKLRRATYYSDQKASRIYTEKFLELAIKRNDTLKIAIANFYLGNSYVSDNDFETGLKYYLKSANYFEHRKDSSRLSSAFNGIGAAYENSGNDSMSLKYFKKAQAISKSIGDLRRSGIALNNIGNIYKNRGNFQQAKQYMQNAVKDISQTNNLQYINPLSLNLANLYVDLKEYDNASKLFEQVLTKLDTVKDVYSYSAVLRGLGNANLSKGNHTEALQYLKKAFQKTNQSGFSGEALKVMPDLIKAYEVNKQYKSALQLANRYQRLKDSIFSTEKDKNLSEALQKYETEKKDAQLKLLASEAEKKEQQRKLYLYLALLGLIIAGLIGFFSYKNKKQNIQLAKQKHLLEITLDEKNTLLKEIHHRVKNSFQIVSSLLFLQSENVDNKDAQLAIKEAKNRVQSMVLIHQRLYSKDDLVGIDTKSYITDLTHDIIDSHLDQGQSLQYDLDIESKILDIETITPLGLILNELITNVIKHAFVSITDSSNLFISLKEDNNKLVLKVRDNGKGMPETVKESSFGIKLIKALSSKIKGELSFTNNNNQGTTATMVINRYNIVS